MIMKKNTIKKITALITSFTLLCSMGAPVYAQFTDPASIYAQYANEKNKSESTQPAETEALPPDDEVKVTESEEIEETPEEKPAAEVKKAETSVKKVKTPAEEVSVYSFKSLIEVGDTFRIGYRLKPAKSDDYVTYTSSNKKVAEVDEDGKITGKGVGNAVITVTASSGKKDRFSLTVRAASVTEPDSDEDAPEDTDEAPKEIAPDLSEATDIELKHSSVTLYQGDTYKIQYELTPKNSTDSVTYRSVNKAVASVDENGVVTARGAGNTRIVCTTGSGAYTKLTVNVLEVMSKEEESQKIEMEIEKEYNENGELVPSEVRFAEESASVKIGETVNLNARVYPSGCTYKYTIGSDNPSVAKVNSFGEVTGISAGNAIITITTDNGKTDSVYVTVYGNVIKGIDVSKWNGDINWKKVKKSGMANFAMIRASYGYEDTDPMLKKNVKGCEDNDIPYGFYHYMYAKSVSEAKKEAAYFLNVIQDYSPTYPVVLDIEEDFYKQMSKKEVTAIVTTFMEAMENAGYYAMIYSYAKFFDDNIIMDKIEKYDIWVACWGDESKLAENYSYHYGMWQYSETGKIAGIEEYVDLNFAYKDYRSTIKKYGLNKPSKW